MFRLPEKEKKKKDRQTEASFHARKNVFELFM